MWKPRNIGCSPTKTASPCSWSGPARGSIYDRLGRTVAEDKENFRIIVIPAFCEDLAATLDAVSRIVPVSAADKDRVMRAARRQSGYFPVLVTEGLTWRQFTLLSVLAPQLSGVRTDRATYRRYNHASSMAHVVGYVGMADKQEVGEDPVMRVPGFRTGKSGVEKGFDRELRGQPGTVKYEVDAHGRVVRELGATPSVRGKDLVLTIDQELQAIALKRIEGLRVASIVVMDVMTGSIIVMASYPTFDPNEVSFKADPRKWAEVARHRDHPLENRALRGQYPPGSTFKVVTGLAGLEAGVITPHERMSCPGGYNFARRRFRCWKTHGGGIDLHQALKQSCDVVFLRDGQAGWASIGSPSRRASSASARFTIWAWPARSKGSFPTRPGSARISATLVCRRNHQLRYRPRLCVDHAAPACGDDGTRRDRHRRGSPPVLRGSSPTAGVLLAESNNYKCSLNNKRNE